MEVVAGMAMAVDYRYFNSTVGHVRAVFSSDLALIFVHVPFISTPFELALMCRPVYLELGCLGVLASIVPNIA